MKLGRSIQNINTPDNKLGKKAFHFRLVSENTSYNLTGYKHNAVTPFALSVSMPMIISAGITSL
jgi:prolyl-tRNA editing enzyme YbaK/EbsC (Cys-tRNA(Pro) deacylase)